MKSVLAPALAASLGASLVAAPARLGAQVGYPPDQSPYRDLEFRQEITPFAGYFAASRDPVRVAPRGGPMLGARYELRIGGPAQLVARVARVFSERTIIDPTVAPAARDLGSQSWPLYLSDVGLSLNLTGQKSLYHFVPVLTGGIGVASDFQGRDVGDYRFGTTFALSFGGGVRWVPGRRFQLRVDVSDYLYQVEYPESYTVGTGGNPPVLSPTQSRNSWQHNAAISVGASYLFFR